MENDIFESEVTFWGKHVAETLGIAAVTLRKWSAELEKQGWEFSRDEQQRRAYTQQDYIALRYLHDLMRDKRMSLEKAVGQVVKRYKNAPETLELTEYRRPDIGERPPTDEQIKLLAAQQMEFMQRQEELNHKLIQRLDDQERYIEERLKVRDEKLTQTLSEVLETKRLLAAAQQQPPKKWYQFWK